MLAATYKTKAELKRAIGQPLRYEETSIFGAEYKANGTFPVVGPSPMVRVWYATVVMADGIIKAVK